MRCAQKLEVEVATYTIPTRLIYYQLTILIGSTIMTCILKRTRKTLKTRRNTENY